MRTHGPYTDAVRLVYEEQLLRNLVHLRYNEPVSSVDISAQFELSAQAEARPFFSTGASGDVFRSFSAVLPDALVHKADRPTFSMSPIDQGDWIRRFLTPAPADTLLFLTETNRPVAAIVRLWVDSLNGVPNGATVTGPRRGPAPDFARFLRVAELLQVAHDRQLAKVRPRERVTELSGPLPADRVTASAVVEAAAKGLEYRPGPDGRAWVLLRKERQLVLEVTAGAGDSPDMAELALLLSLVPGLPRYDLVVAPGGVPDPRLHPRPPSAELSAVPRSISPVFYLLSNGVEVPADHLEADLVQPPIDEEGKAFDDREATAGLFTVHACKAHKPPRTAYVAVRYRDYWYFTDDRDAGKATLALMMHLVRLDFSRKQEAPPPLLTQPVGR